MILITTFLKSSIHLARQNYYLTIFTKFKDGIRGTWKAINEILNKSKRKKHFTQYYKDGDNLFTNKQLISNKVNSFFTNIGPTLSSQIKVPQNKTFKSYLTQIYNINFSFQSIDEETVSQMINKLSPKTIFGYDRISTKLLKNHQRCYTENYYCHNKSNVKYRNFPRQNNNSYS